MSTSNHYRPNNPNVIYEVIDGEAVLVSLESGSYYSIDNVGAAIWSHIENGLSVSQIVDAVAGQYEGSLDEIQTGIQQLFTQLQNEGLIIPVESAQSDGHVAVPASNGQTNKPPFEQPILNKYNDMEDLLLLDPIHEVDETGWPQVAENE